MTTTEVWHALAGGALIGTGSATLLLLNGRIAGVSGILGNVIRATAGEQGWRIAFLICCCLWRAERRAAERIRSLLVYA